MIILALYPKDSRLFTGTQRADAEGGTYQTFVYVLSGSFTSGSNSRIYSVERWDRHLRQSEQRVGSGRDKEFYNTLGRTKY